MAGFGLDTRGVIAACTSCGQKNRLPFGRLGETTRCGKCRTPLSPPAASVHVRTDEEFATLVRESALPVLVDFWAEWCAPCRSVAPELERVAAASAGRLLVAKVDTEALTNVAAQFGIRSIPTMALFAGGREVARTSGARPASAIQQFVSEALSGARKRHCC